MNRDKIDNKYKWDLTLIFKNISEFRKEYNDLKQEINEFSNYKDNMLDNANNFYKTIKKSFEIERRLNKLYCYTSLLSDLDTSNNDNEALSEEVNNLLSLYNSNFYFVIPFIMKKDIKEIKEYYKEVPELKKYDLIIKRIFRYKSHTLGDNEEKLLSSISKMTDNNYKTYELLKDCDMSLGYIKDENNKKQELTDSNYSIYIESDNRRVRKEAFECIFNSYGKYKNTFSSLLTGNIKEVSVLNKLRNYMSSIESSLYDDEIDVSIYNNLIETVTSNLNVLDKYYNLKKEELKIDEMHIYDVYAPIGNFSNKKYPYDDAINKVIDVLSIYGDEYITTLKQGIKDRWIDVYPTKNKRTGGYSGGCYDTNPYILLNYQDKYDDMSTLAHEMGHSMHSYFSRKYNDYEYSDYSIFVAEVASTVNELLLAKSIINSTSDISEKKFILEKLMNLFRATIYRQTLFAEFEKILYEKIDNDDVLTADKISEIYYNLNKKYYSNSVIIDDNVKYEWIRIPHFYYNFYVYKYATGLSAACYIVEHLLNEKDYVNKYLNFLKCGSSKSPIDSLKEADVDLTRKEVIESAISMFDSIIDEYKNL